MRTRTKALVAAFGASLLLALAVSSASPNSLSLTEQQFRITWAPLTFNADDAGLSAACNVTLSGSFNSRTLTKTINSLIGFINRGTVNTCSAGDAATILSATFPWPIQYDEFHGILPSILSVRLNLVRASVQFDIDGTVCLFQTTQAEPFSGLMSRDTTTGQIALFIVFGTRQIDISDMFTCEIFGHGSFAGTGQVRTGAGTGLILLLLI